MAALFRQLVDVCGLRRGPQDLDYSPSATATAVVALLVLQAVVGAWAGVPEEEIAGRLAVTLLMLVGVTTLLLGVRGVGNRTAQTLLAQAGAGVLFSLAVLPLAWVLRPYVGDAAARPPPTAMLAGLAALALFVWKLRVDAAIWADALEISRPRATLLAVVLVVAKLVLLRLLSPVSVGVAS